MMMMMMMMMITHVNYQKVIEEGNTGNQALFGQKTFREFT